ncbi:hypothetical protein K439DRAFT_1626625 [Ramaria rubella]|nr:hypothetical protein K439DRAFT_1626625 [Ramaria rubella]
MILNDKSVRLPADPIDAPPAYNDIERGDPSRLSVDQKSPGGSGQSSEPRAGPSTLRSKASIVTTTSQSNLAGKTSGAPVVNKNWFSWYSEKDTRKEVKQTIQSIMRDVVKEASSPAAVSVLQSCLEACQARGLSFQSLVSEKFIEGHCPLYWAIVRHPATESQENDDHVQLLDILLSIPLNSTTRSEAYLACLLSSDQDLFQRLRHTPGDHSPSVSAAHELLLGNVPEDDVRSFDKEADHGEFRIVWKIAQFQKRMRAIGGVGTEVVARGRIWSLAFAVLPRDIYSSTTLKAGTWVASVAIIDPSPPTHLDARFLISEPMPDSRATSPPGSPKLSTLTPDTSFPVTAAAPRKNSFVPWSRETPRPKQTITLRVKTDTSQLQPLPLLSTKQDLRDHVLSHPGTKSLIVPLSSHFNGDSLQFDGCSYLNSDGSLNVTLDARLKKTDTGSDCVIC